MSLYTQTNSDMIQEVCLNYDEHSYSEATYALYEEMCYYTLKVFLPELSEDEIISLYKEVNEIGEKHIFPHENGYTNQSIPYAILYKDSVGIYPYFAVGESLHLCIIPINDEVLEYYGSLGSQIKEIPPRGQENLLLGGISFKKVCLKIRVICFQFSGDIVLFI